MRKMLLRVAAAALAGALIVCGSDVRAFAAVEGTLTGAVVQGEPVVAGEVPLGGFSWYLDNFYSNIYDETTADTTSLLAESITISENIAIAKVDDKLNIRSGPGTNYELTGYLPKNAYCYVLEVKDGWAKISSGSIKGYVSTDYLYMGEEGVRRAKEVGVLTADVQAGKVNLRSEPTTSTDENIIAVATSGMELEVLQENVLTKNEDEAAIWAMVRYEESTAYIAKQFVTISYKWLKAKPVEKPIVTSGGSSSSGGGSSSGSSSGTASSVRAKIASVAQQYVGLRYVYGGNSLSSGADCSGFCLAVYRASGVNTSNIPRSSREMASSSKGRTVSLSNIQPGDLVFYGSGNSVSHVALYIGGGKVANMSSVGMKMRIDNVKYRSIIKIKNFLD